MSTLWRQIEAKFWKDFHLRKAIYLPLSISVILFIFYFNLSRENTKSEYLLVLYSYFLY